MADQESNVLEGDPNPAPATAPAAPPVDKPEVDPATTAFIDQWVSRIKSAKGAKRIKEAFKRMDDSMQLAKDGAEKGWVEGGNYTVPILNRLTNLAVGATLRQEPYGHREAQAPAHEHRLGRHAEPLNEARNMQAAAQHSQQMANAYPSAVISAVTAKRLPPPPPATDGPECGRHPGGRAAGQAIRHDHGWHRRHHDAVVRLYFIQDPAAQYKQQFKALVRRAKVCSVGYVKLGYQRIREPDPDATVKLADATEKLETMRQLMAKGARDDLPEGSADEEQLRTLIADLQQQQMLVVQEGPVLSFPRSKRVIIDPECVQLKTLAGANWLAEEYEMTPDRIEEVWRVDIAGQFTPYTPNNDSWSAGRRNPARSPSPTRRWCGG